MASIRRRRFVALAAAALAATRSHAAPPELKALQIVVPTPPGTQPDLIARWLVEPMARHAGVAGGVLNRPGAAGAIAADAVLAGPAEQGLLLLGGLDHVAYSHLNSQRRPLDPFVDFVPVGAVNRDTWLLAVSAERGLQSVGALRDGSRVHGPFAYPSAGVGTTAHLLSARLCDALGINAEHVPYKESFLPDLISGRVHFALAPTPGLLGSVRAGRLRALASLTDERQTALDGVPSIRELGLPGQAFYGGLFLFAPAALAAHADRLNGWLLDAMRLPETVARYRDAAIEPAPFDLARTRQTILDRLRLIDAMRLQVFGRTR
jgi:tripartite-type tricarboxylate transporter receptor subunit TctC